MKKKENNNDERKKALISPYMKKLLQSAASMVVCVVIIICAVFAWFQTDRTVVATGAATSVVGIKTLKVAATAGGPDISTLTAPENLLTVNVENDSPELYPGISGKFSVYLTVTGTTTDSLVKITPEILAGGIDRLGNVVEDYRDSEFTDTEKKQAIDFTNGHILLFKSFESGVYSGFVDPLGQTDFTVSANIENKVDFYWIWVDSYYKLCESSELIAAADITKIRSNYVAESSYTAEASQYLFDTRGATLLDDSKLSQLTHYYDFADGDIGSVVSHVFFRLNITLN